ncbi:MAG: type II toxin-antitoxin system RelE/ParE family toxin [bacterium]
MTLRYRIRVDSRVVKELRRLPVSDAERLIESIECLANNPRPPGARKLVNQPGWRIRIGSYRVLYEINDSNKVVTVYRAGHRREVYR